MQPWDAFRTFGPLSAARYDPHPEPRGEHPGFGITYAAADVTTTVAEVFQDRRTVNASGSLHLTSWTPTRALKLLDLTGDWALRNGAAHALAAAPRPTCRWWSRSIRETWDWLDGLWAPSTLTGRPMVALYEPAGDSFPPAPAFTRPLDNDVVWDIVADAAVAIGYQQHR